MPNLLSLAPLTINDAAPLELIDGAASGGFDAVGLRIVGPPGTDPVTPIVGEAALIRAIKRRFADRGVGFFAATGIWLTPDLDVAALDRELATAAELGASWFLAAGYDPDTARLCDNFTALCEAAAGFGLKIAFEFMPYIETKTLGEAHRVVQQSRRPNAGILVDVLHLARSGGTPAEVAAVAPELIAYLQLCDAPRQKPAQLQLREESLRDRLYPGEGELWLYELMDALPRDVAIDLETPHAKDRALPAAERARRAGDATRRFLAAYWARSNRPPSAAGRLAKTDGSP
jgi:sugar phosphate isomerase/epimerase